MAVKKFSIIHVPVLSFFSKELYRDVALHWKGVNFLYLLLLLAVCWILVMVKVQIGFANFVNNKAAAIVEQVPEITITDGKVSISEPQPYYIIDPESDDVLIIIDTTGQIESLEETEAFCLLTEDEVISRESEFETRAFDLSNVKEFVVDSERITNWLHTGRKILVVIMYPFALIGSYLFRIIQSLIYAVIGLLFASCCKTRLSYAALLRLTVVAMTPCLLAKTIFVLADVRLPYQKLIFLVVTLSCLYFAVKTNSEIELIPQEAEEQIEEITLEQ